MSTADPPRAVKARTTRSNSSASPGASTAVGSSSSRTRTSVASAFTISSRCLRPTESRPAGVSGSRGNPIRSASARTRSRRAAGCTGQPAASATFSATLSAGTDVKCWWTMPTPRRRAARGDGTATTVAGDRDGAGVRARQAVGHVHQGGLAGAVLAQERMELARHQREIGPAQGLHGAEVFPDASERERWRRGHRPVGWSWNSQSRSKRSARCEASAWTPSVSVA